MHVRDFVCLVLAGLGSEPGLTNPIALPGSDRHVERATFQAGILTAVCLVADDAPAIPKRDATPGELEALTRPSMVRLDFHERPLDQVIATIAARSHLRLLLDNSNKALWEKLRITLTEPEPVPFWQAIDRLAHVARLQYNFAIASRPGEPVVGLRLFHPGQPPSEPVTYYGPFRISLRSIRAHNQAQPAGAIKRNGAPRWDVHLKIMGEPRMKIGMDDVSRHMKIVDDRGRSYASPLGSGPDMPLNWGFKHLNTVPEVDENLSNLETSSPGPPGKSLMTIKGTVRIAVEARRADPIVIPIPGGGDRTYTKENVMLEVLDVRLQAGRRPVIDLAARPDPAAPAPSRMFDVESTYWAGGQIEVVNAQGKPIAWVPGQPPAPRAGFSTTLRILPDDRADPPAQVRFHGLTRTILEVPYVLKDVPMP